MSIDWITVAAQIANFLVLVWLLKRFLYRPILDGIDAREAEITARMQEAAKAKAKAEATEAAFHEQSRALHVAQSELTETVRKKAEAQRDALLAEAQKKMQREQAEWQAHLDEEAHKYTAKLHGAGAAALLALTRKALCDLADETLEARMAQHLLTQIKPMAADMTRAAGQATAAIITSHDTLPDPVQDSLRAELRAVFPQVAVTFQTDPDQSPGLVLRMGGAQLAWTVDTYIDGLDASIAKHLTKGPDPRAKTHGQ
ncbi:F0F1 ATP synthase subunit B [Rhodobacteraceae bacterium KMM 6894]|nr:F0F1 ATP synthase subunit B [Rhodobacteraceae bacterium KMM 6894]